VLDTSALSIKLRFIDLKSNWTDSQTLKLEAGSLLGNQTTEISRIPVPGPSSPSASTTKPLVHTSHTVIVVASLVDTQTGRVLAQDVDWPQPYKYYSHLLTGDRGVTISVNGDEVRVKSARPIKCLWLSVEGDNEPEWSDNGFDVIPGEADVVISAPGLNGREVKAVWLGKEKL
jgi:beta-mannosidase